MSYNEINFVILNGNKEKEQERERERERERDQEKNYERLKYDQEISMHGRKNANKP